MQSSYVSLVLAFIPFWISISSLATERPSSPCDSSIDGAKCTRAELLAAGQAGSFQGLAVSAPHELPDPFKWNIPRSTQSLIFFDWGDEIEKFDDVIDVIEHAQLRLAADIKFKGYDDAMPNIKTWTFETVQLVAVNDVGLDGMTHKELVDALAGLRLAGELMGFWQCHIQLDDSRLTLYDRGKIRLTLAPPSAVA